MVLFLRRWQWIFGDEPPPSRMPPLLSMPPLLTEFHWRIPLLEFKSYSKGDWPTLNAHAPRHSSQSLHALPPTHFVPLLSTQLHTASSSEQSLQVPMNVFRVHLSSRHFWVRSAVFVVVLTGRSSRERMRVQRRHSDWGLVLRVLNG